MEDYIIRIIAKEAGVRGLASISTGVANEGARRHETTATASAALACGLTGALLFGSLLKVNQRVAIKMAGDGPLQKMVVEANNYGKVRGYVANPAVDLPLIDRQPDVAAAIGHSGLLTVAKDLGMKEIHEGIVSIENGLVDKELAHYMKKSEQTDTLIEIGSVLADDGSLAAVGGLLVQAMPGEHAPVLKSLSERLYDLPPIAEFLQNDGTPEDLLADLFYDIEYELLEKHSVQFQCNCGWARSEKALLSLGRTELESLMAEGETVIDCHFCHEQYIFSEEAIETILDKLSS